MICQNTKCGCTYTPWRKRQKFCSQNCADELKRRIDIAQLKKLVFTGETKAAIARHLGVSLNTVRRAIRDFGLEGSWHEQRYA
jgi:transposase